MKQLRIFLQIIIGISIIVLILSKLNINEVISVLKQTSLLFFLLACVSYLCLNFVLVSRLFYLLTKIGYHVKYSAVFFSHMGGMFAGDITPGRSGYFLTPPILKNNAEVRITDGMACIFAPQAIEFILKVGGAIAAILYLSTFSGVSKNFFIYAGMGAFLLLIVGILMLIVSWKNENLTSRFLSKLPFFRNFTENLSSFKEKNIGIKESTKTIIILSLIGWVFAASHWFFIGKALGFELSFFTFFLLHPLITILMFVPLSPAGLGLMEGGAIVALSFFGVSPAMGLAFSVLVRFSILLVDLIGLRTLVAASNELGMKR